MDVELLEIGVKVRKGVIFTVRGCLRSVSNHPFLVGMLCFLIFLYRSSPFIFQLLVSASPILVCTAVLLGTLLSFGQPNIPEIEIEEKTTVEAVSIKTGVLGDTTVVEKNESHYVERFSESRWDEAERSTELPELSAVKLVEVRREEDSDDAAPLIEERSLESELIDGENWGANRDLGNLRFKGKTEWIEERLNSGSDGENHQSHPHSSAARLNGELESDDEKSEADSFGSEKVNVDSLDSPPRSPWARVAEREDEEAESDKEEEEDEEEDSDSGSDCAESSSPDASMADIMPMLDELHPLLDHEAPHTVHLSCGSSDAASEKSLKSSASNHQSDNESESHEDLEVGDDDDDGEDEEDAQGDKDEETKSAITWTEEDQKNLMDLGSSEIERNLRLENLILRRRARKTTNSFTEKNLIDLESSDLPFNIAPISTRRQNPFDLPHDYYDHSLPPIPGSAPSVLLPRRNPFDIPYDSSEEKPDLKGDVFQEEFTSHSKESFFRRHESFNLGPSIFAPRRQDVKMRPYFVPEGTISEESSSSLFRRQSSELSDSKVSSIPETESITSVEDLEDKKFPERDTLPEREVVELTKEVAEVVPDLISLQEVNTEEDMHREEVEAEEDVHQEPEMISKTESVSELIANGSQSSEQSDSLELGQVEKRAVEVGEFESQLDDVMDHYEEGSATQYMDVRDFGYGSNFEAVEPRYTRVSSSSSLSEESERVFIDTEGEGLAMMEGTREDGADEPSISTRTSLGSTDLNITSALVNSISHTEPVYDLSPRELSKNVSTSSICSDVLPESDRGLPPVLDKITLSSIGGEFEGSSRETETDLPRNIEMLLDSSTSHSVAAESRFVDVVDIREHDIVNTDFSEGDQRSVGEGSSTADSYAPHMSIPLRSHGEALMEEHLMEKHILDEGSVSISDTNIHAMVRSSEDQDLEQAEDKHLLLSGTHGLTEASEIQLEGLPREHSNAVDETVQSPSSDADIQHETDEKLTSMLSAEGNTSLFYDNAIQEPDFNYLNEVQASSTPIESLLDNQITREPHMPDFLELDRYINSPSSPKFISFPPSAIETISSTVDVQTVVEEVDEIKEIDEGFLSELDNVGDFSLGRLAFGMSEFEKHVDSVGEESLSSTHRAEVKKIEHLLHSEESREHIDVYEQNIEHFSEQQTYQTSTAVNIEEVSRKEFDENDNGSPYQETSGVEAPCKENELLPDHSLVNYKHEDNVSGIPEVEVGSIENVGVVAEKAELVSVETDVMVGVDEVPCQGQVDTDSTSGMPKLEDSSVEDIDLAFMQVSSKETEKNFVFDPPQSELQNHEDAVSKKPESEVPSIDDVDTVPKKPESTSVETDFVIGVAEVSCQRQIDTDTTFGMPELEASTVEDIDLAFERISSEEIEQPQVLEPVHSDTPSQILELEASKTEDIDVVSQKISSEEIEKPVVLEPPQAELHKYEDSDSELPEQEVQLAEDVHAVPKYTELTSVETEIIMEGADVSSQGLVHTDITSETTESEASTVEEIDLAFEQIISRAVEKPVDLEPVDSDTTLGMPEIEASSVEAIHLAAFKHIGSEEIKNHDVLEPLQPELVVGETITEKSEDTAPHRVTSVPVSTIKTSVLEVGPSKDAIMDDKQLTGSITNIDGLHDSVDTTENSEDVVLNRDRSVMVSTDVTSVVEVGQNNDAILDNNKLTDSITGTDRLHDSVDRTLHVAEVVPSEDTTLPPNQVSDGERQEQLKLKSDDESVKFKADDNIVLSEEKSSVQESSALEDGKPNHEDGKPNHEDEAPKDSHSPSSVKGKGKMSRSSSSSSSSDSSSSDSDKE